MSNHQMLLEETLWLKTLRTIDGFAQIALPVITSMMMFLQENNPTVSLARLRTVLSVNFTQTNAMSVLKTSFPIIEVMHVLSQSNFVRQILSTMITTVMFGSVLNVYKATSNLMTLVRSVLLIHSAHLVATIRNVYHALKARS